MIPKHIVDDIMAATRIEEVIGDFLALKKSGSDLKALSPFAQEKTPSFFVSPVKQIFKDFSSGKGGNAVTFLMEHEHISYPEALRYLAKKYHIAIPEEKEFNEEEIKQANEKESLLILLQWALEFYTRQLEDTEDGRAIGKSYFFERGFREETLARFGLGFSPNQWDALTKAALAAGFKLEYLELAGLTKTNEQGKQYDMFRGRVIFPIHNLVGKVVAFAGRQLSKEDRGPKYLNSPETPVYHKSDILYGLYQAKNAIRIHDKCYLVEGYTDVITLNQAGIENVVASSGTSLTEGQIRQIKRFTQNITVLYDGDPAGLKASQRGIDLILAQGQNVRLVIFPDGEDPDSYCKKVGGEAFEAYIKDHEQDFILFKSQLLMGESGNDPLRKIEALKSIVGSISLIPDPLTRTVFAQECARIMQVQESVIMAELNKARKKELEKDQRSSVSTADVQDFPPVIPPEEEELTIKPADTIEQEKAIIRLLIRHSEEFYAEEIRVLEFILNEIAPGMEFSDELCARVLEEARQQMESGEIVNQSFFTQHPEPAINSFAADALMEKYLVSPDWEEKFEIPVVNEKENYRQDLFGSILHYKIRKVETFIEKNSQELRETTDEEAIDLLMQKQVHLLGLRKQLTELIGTTIIR